ncbi:MAG: DUF2339 domain-containing protein [Sphingobacteriales bacterium]|nr:DUF2339 domain-containing protein [Sphingobacteriales bacterium]
MGGLILLVILAILIFIVLPLGILVKAGEQRRLLESLYDSIKDLKNDVATLSKEVRDVEVISKIRVLKNETPEIMTSQKPVAEEKPVSIPVQQPEEVTELIGKKEKFMPQLADEREIAEEMVELMASAATQSGIRSKKHTDLEKFIGENLANKIGIAVLVLGIAFFVKYAIDKNWITETGRVIIGLISGSILIGLAHYFRNKYRSFSSVLVGGGLTVYYFSIAFAFHQYHLIGQTAAFIFMLAVSAFAVGLSLFYNRQELAILATIGGFITPFLVNTGQENHIALFTYLCILNTGLIALSWFKRWPAINIIALFFTTIIFGSWLIRHLYYEDVSSLPYSDALLFATLFYLLFILMNIINCVRLKKEFSWFDFIILFSVNFLYYAAGMIVLDYWGYDNLQGLFTASAGIFNLLLTLIFYRQKNIDRNFVFLLMGLSLTFISLFAPVQFNGNYVTLFWLTESIVLLFIYQRSKISLLKVCSLLVTVLMFISLITTWIQVYLFNNAVITIIANKGFITTLSVAAGLFLYKHLLRKEKERGFINSLDTVIVKKTMNVAAILILYLSGMFELYYQFSTRFQQSPVHSLFIQAYSFAFVIVLLGIYRKESGYPLMKIILTGYCFILYLFNISAGTVVSESLLNSINGKNLFTVHWAAVVLLLWLLVDFVRFFFYRNQKEWKEFIPAFTWAAVSGMVLLLSIEMYQVMLWADGVEGSERLWWENLYYKAGLTILWSISSFIMMWLGMKLGFRVLRIISLTLFTITLVKLFIYDIRNIPPGGKIAAFVLLGCLLLVVSFMYQRLKKIIIDDSPPAAGKNNDRLQYHH